MPLSLPSRPRLDQLKKQAKDLLAAWQAGDAEAFSWLREHHPAHRGTTAAAGLQLADAQLVTARRYGFPSWPRLREEIELANLAFAERARLFVRAATDESTGAVDAPFRQAQRLLARDPTLARADVWSALVLGDVDTVARRIAAEPRWVGEKGGPQERQPLHYVTYSKFHRESPEIAQGLLATARLLLDHGADPDASFVLEPWPQNPLRPLLGACGVANFPEMAELLLDRGATIDDNESLYHATEHADTRCLALLLARGANPRGTNALHHAFDRQGTPGLERARLLLEHGADPNEALNENDGPPLFVAIQRGRERALLELLVAHGADVHFRRRDGRSAYQVAMSHGHAEAVAYLEELGVATDTTPFERFVGACGRGDLAAAREIASATPRFFESLSHPEGQAYLRLAQSGRAATLAVLLDASFPVNASGPAGQTALHWAAWHGWRDTVQVLLARGAAVGAVEHEFGGTPLVWAIHGSDNYPNPDGDYPGVVRLLLAAGAEIKESMLESDGNPEIADLLRAAFQRERV
ncbi:MAG TPA: ankyrin repeat domain-containing protein [Thermoanaerobaculia bacterium]|nr:ankyrin repeat domain-containing protein [Thermoanaerobaculia bacterium]